MDPRILSAGKKNWCTVPDHYFRKMGRLNFLLRCNYNVNYFDKLPVFYKTILESFSELNTLHGYDETQDLVLFNNKDILVGGRPVYFHEWFKRGVVFINDLLNENGKFLTFKEVSDKYKCKTKFLQYYQVISAMPTSFLTKAMPLLTNYSSHAMKYLNSMIMLKFIWVKLDLKTFTNYSTTTPTWATILVLLDGARVSH